MGDVDRLKNDFVTVAPSVAPEGCGLKASGMRADGMAVAWVHHGDIFTKRESVPEVSGAELLFEGLKQDAWRVEYWDTCAAKIVREESVGCGADGTVRLRLPPVRRDLAVKMRRAMEKGY